MNEENKKNFKVYITIVFFTFFIFVMLILYFAEDKVSEKTKIPRNTIIERNI